MTAWWAVPFGTGVLAELERRTLTEGVAVGKLAVSGSAGLLTGEPERASPSVSVPTSQSIRRRAIQQRRER